MQASVAKCLSSFARRVESENGEEGTVLYSEDW